MRPTTSVRVRLLVLTALLLSGNAALAIYGYSSMNRIRINGPLYMSIVSNKDVVADILPPPAYIIESYLNALQMLEAAEAGADRETLRRMAEQGTSLSAAYEQRIAHWQHALPAGELRQQLVNACAVPARAFFAARDRDFIPALLAGDLRAARTVHVNLLQPRYAAHRAAVDRTVVLARAAAQETERRTTRDLARTLVTFAGLGLLITACGILLSIRLSRSITAPLAQVTATARDISDGHYHRVPHDAVPPPAEIGMLTRSFNEMGDRVQSLIAELQERNRQLGHEIEVRRQTEEALREAHASTEQRVVARTRELQTSNDRLEHEIAIRHQVEALLKENTAALQRSNSELEQFAYVASHDLQEPLRMIASYLQLLARRYRDRLDRDATEFIDFAVDGSRRLQTLISDLLAYSRIGTHGRQPVPVDCAAAVRQALDNLAAAVQESAASISYTALPVVRGEPTQLMQVFQNLLGNAIKFRAPGRPPVITISACAEDGLWYFTVRDNGIGIAPEHHARIFQVFQRLHTRDEYPGTGIGLAVCRKIIERHGGTIRVTATPGEGCTFHFTLPVTDGSA